MKILQAILQIYLQRFCLIQRGYLWCNQSFHDNLTILSTQWYDWGEFWNIMKQSISACGCGKSHVLGLHTFCVRCLGFATHNWHKLSIAAPHNRMNAPGIATQKVVWRFRHTQINYGKIFRKVSGVFNGIRHYCSHEL